MTQVTNRKIMIVGAAWDQTPIIFESKRQGYCVIALDGNPDAYGLQFADRAHVVSTRDPEGVLEVAQSERIDAITYMITESPMFAIRHVVDAMGLIGPSQKSVEATVSKIRMREIFADANIPNARFGKATTLEEALALVNIVGLPLVMKSSDVGGQLGLFKIETIDEIKQHFEDSKQYSLSGQVILEEWLEGSEVNVVAIVLNGIIQEMTVSDRLTDPTQAFGIVNRHLYPAQCTAAELAQIQQICQQTVEAMEIHNGIIFPQIILTPRGPILAETGERIPGGVMKELFELATGYDLVKLQIDIAFNQVRDLIWYKQRPAHAAVTVKFLNCQPGPLKPGKVARVQGREQVLQMPAIFDAQFYNDPSKPQEIRPLRTARDRFFYIIAVGQARQEVIMLSDQAADLISFFDEAGNSLLA